MNEPPATPKRKIPFWRRCIRWALCIIGLLFILAIVAFLFLSSGGDAAVQKARATADAQDSHWRLDDAYQKLPSVPGDEDAGEFLFAGLLSIPPKPWPCLGFRDFNLVLAFKTQIDKEPPSLPCNHRLRPPELAALQKSMTAMENCFALAEPGLACKSVNFRQKVNHKDGDVVEITQVQGLLHLGEAYRQLAVSQCLSQKAGCWQNLVNALKVNDYIIDPSLRTSMWRNYATHNSLIAAEYLLGQTANTDAELSAYQNQLALRLENPVGLRAALFYYRAMADEWLKAFDRQDPDFLNREIRLPSILMAPSVKHGLAEMITFLTEALATGNATNGEFEKWFQSYLQQYVKYEDMQVLLYPKNYFLNDQLPRIKKLIYDYYGEQDEVRLGLLAIAVERYRLKHGRFPQKIDDLAPFFTAREWALMPQVHSKNQFTLESTEFGLVIREKDGSENARSESNWEQFGPGNYERYGFKLYRTELRGKTAPPKSSDSQETSKDD